mgnify:CR=1 FL=1
MEEYNYESMLQRLQEEFEQGQQTLQGLSMDEHRIVDEVQASSQEMLHQAKSRNAQLEEQLDSIKQAYLRSSDLQSLKEPELIEIMTKFGGQDVALLHEDIKSLQQEVHSVEKQVVSKQQELIRAEQIAEETRKTVETDLVPLERLQLQLQTREEELRSQIQAAGKQEAVVEFFNTQKQLIAKQEELEQELHEKEQLLLALRQDICSIDVNGSNFSESERENAELYVEWKEILQQKAEQYITFRQKQYELLMHINGRRETLRIITDLLTESKLEELHNQETEAKRNIDKTTQRIATLQRGLETTQAAIDGFRVEFEQIRVAILLDKATKTTDISQLRRQRNQLQKSDDHFRKLYEQEKEKIIAETEAVWQKRFAVIQKEGTAELKREQRALAKKMGLVKAALKKRFESGLQPILDKVKAACATELEQQSRLQGEIASKEKLVEQMIDESHELQQRISDVEDVHVDETAAVRERDALLSQLQQLWQDTNASVDDIASFHSDLDLMAPFNERVLEFYETNSQQLV